MDENHHQAVIQERIRHYFNQLTVGCGDASCTNQNCASSANFAHRGLDNNRAAALALTLLRDQEPMCFRSETNATPKESNSKPSENQTNQSEDVQMNSESTQASGRLSPLSTSYQSRDRMDGVGLADEERDGDGELPDTLEGSTPTSSISEISPGLSRFLLHFSGNSPPSGQTFLSTVDTGDALESSRQHQILGFLDSMLKRSAQRSAEEVEDDPELSSTAAAAGAATTSSGAENKRVAGLCLAELRECIENCEANNNWAPLRRLVDEVFTSITCLANSFPREADVAGGSPPGDVEMPATAAETESSNNYSQEQTTATTTTTATATTGASKGSCEHAGPFLNADSDPAFPLDIEEAREAYRLLLDRAPRSLGLEELLAHLIRRQLIVTLRRVFRIYPFPSAPTSSSSNQPGADVAQSLRWLKRTSPTPGGPQDKLQQRMVNLFAVIYACPMVTDPLHFEPILPHLCHLTVSLPMATQARLCRTWAVHAREQRAAAASPQQQSTPWLLELHHILMQQITLRCLALEPAVRNPLRDLEAAEDDAPLPPSAPNDDRVICEAARVLRVVFFASLLAGGVDPPAQLAREAAEAAETQVEMMAVFSRQPSASSSSNAAHRFDRANARKDPLGVVLGISANDCRHPLIPPSEFLNETLNDFIVAEKDFANFRSQRVGLQERLSFMELPFMLQTTTKSTQLYYDNRLNMLQERRGAILNALLATSSADTPLEMPFFKICVNRERVVEDALVALDLARSEAVGDLKKQLYVEFDGEQGIDEGGLSKEFFQLIVERIFNPDYGMFVYEEESHVFWFNRSPLAEELEREYCLIGTILGLAIYNNVILDIHFPAVLFRKLCGKLASSVEDLQDGWPALAHGLQQLLEYDGDDFEGDHCLNFVVTYSDMFGQVVTHDLVPGGANKPVTLENRQEFVDLTVDFLLNTSVKKQFEAFHRGFLLVVGDTPLFFLFSPQEIELLLLGSQKYDFGELERVTEYEGDYSAETPVVRNFWSVVHALGEEDQRRLLQFATGTDRVPVGGMAHMKFVIARQGPDSDRLPTAHTCFNVLLLPEYSSKEKLERCLRTAIAYSKGFGML